MKPIRIWMHVGDRDLFNPNVMRDDMHDWVVANQHMAKALADKGYKYQFVFARDSGHCDRNVKQQTLPNALEFVWKDYPDRREARASSAANVRKEAQAMSCTKRRTRGQQARIHVVRVFAWPP